MASDRDRIDALIDHLDEFLSGADRRRSEVPIEVGSDRRWSIGVSSARNGEIVFIVLCVGCVAWIAWRAFA